MSKQRLDADVIVVGAGPVGLMLAGELRLAEADVIVLEKRSEPMDESRASQLNARTMEIFDRRGLLNILDEPEREDRGHFGGLPLRMDVNSAYSGNWKIPQYRTEAALGQWSTGLGARLLRGRELLGLEATGDRVEAVVSAEPGAGAAADPIRLGAAYLVGCDGEASTARRLGGFEFIGHDAAMELLRADVSGVDIPDRRFERLEHGLAIAVTRGGVTRVMMHAYGREAVARTRAPSFDEISTTWAEITGEDLSAGQLIWADSFGDTSRLATQYRRGRVLLAGDAAHRMMPVGGQALNIGLQDAANLGWKLGAEIRGWAPPDLLDTYDAERRPVAERVLASVEAQKLVLLGDQQADAVRQVFAELLGIESARGHLAEVLSGLDIRYPVGPGDHRLLGARMPGRPPRTARGALLVGTKGSSASSAIRDLVSGWADRVEVVPAELAETDLVSEDCGFDAALVRPDGHVVWAIGPDRDADLGELGAALRRWFGASSEAAGGGGHAERYSEGRKGRKGTTMSRLAGRSALVTGSSRGIGRATAERLARDGALVAVHYATNREAADQTVKNITAAGGRAFAIQAELGVAGDIDTLFVALTAGLREHQDEVRLDILVNNAGIMGGVKPEELTPDTFDRLVAVNAKAPLFIVQRALRIMPDGGRIINISSGLTRFANPDEVAYSMTKGAVEQIALHYARLLGPRGITINSVAPGITNNGSPVFDIPEAKEQMAQLSTFGRVGEPADVADVVAFLASPDARWVTGAFIDATGGTLLG
ncbi:MAG TPA: SDR family oxidoreductase [Streptosporangiaceae bacterium]|nr:SDR family oxidoreductase [Streptosporangiaceae bacterium]